ncbi:hypothetical protein TNCV_96751 [Trichonephila clavipes]|nr:hypothetical protein TNCV_96751 [Trichonephila clavipes]
MAFGGSLPQINLGVQEHFENESDGNQKSCSNLDSDKDIRLSESDCVESGESADKLDNIPVNPESYVARDGTE